MRGNKLIKKQKKYRIECYNFPKDNDPPNADEKRLTLKEWGSFYNWDKIRSWTFPEIFKKSEKNGNLKGLELLNNSTRGKKNTEKQYSQSFGSYFQLRILYPDKQATK